MDILELIFWVVGSISLLLILAGLQRYFFPYSMVNGLMDIEKLKEICPDLFKTKDPKGK